MLLSDRDLTAAIKAGTVALDPFDPELVQPSSIDVRLDRQFRVFNNHLYTHIDPTQRQEDLTTLVEVADDEPFVLHPGEFALAARGRNVVALAGIGNPQRFFDHLEGLGVRARNVALPDHHHYQARDLKLPHAELIVMTEKDAVKCAAFADSRMWFLRVEAILPREFEELLLERLASTRRSNGPQAA